MCGTDFSMMEQLFPERTRAQLKAKFKVEERANGDAVTRALTGPIRPYDPSYFPRPSFKDDNKMG